MYITFANFIIANDQYHHSTNSTKIDWGIVMIRCKGQLCNIHLILHTMLVDVTLQTLWNLAI